MQRAWPEFRHPLFVVSVLLYAAYQLNRYVLHWPMPTLLTSYLGDLAAMPVMLSLALAAQRRLGRGPLCCPTCGCWLPGPMFRFFLKPFCRISRLLPWATHSM